MRYFFLQCSCYLFCPGRLQLHDSHGCGSTVADPPRRPCKPPGLDPQQGRAQRGSWWDAVSKDTAKRSEKVGAACFSIIKAA